MLRSAAFVFVLALLAPAFAGCLSDLTGGLPGPGVEASGAIVASSNALAAAAGAAILRAGGNAVDAAAAVQFALTVVEPHFSGIGGGAFVMIRDPSTGEVVVLDGRERAPASATATQFLDENGEPQSFAVAHTRGYAVGIPGTVRVWADAVERFGKLSLAETLAPALAYAADGFIVDPFLAKLLADPEHAEKLRSWPPSAEVFYKDIVCASSAAPPPMHDALPCVGGEPFRAGELMKRPDLARSFRLLTDQGPAVFYEGEIADAIIATVSEREGRMTRADFATYAVTERAPIRASYRGLDVVTMPPPGGGLVVAQMLGILEGFDIRALGHNTVDSLHILIETMHLAYADRGAYLGDPDHVDVPSAGLLDPAYITARRALIDPARANPDVKPGDPWQYQERGSTASSTPTARAPEGQHTSHYLVVDADGMIVTATGTIEQIFGSGMLVPGYGFMLNNEMTDFDFVPGGPNEVAPGKRPRSAMSPTIVLDQGKPILVLGAAGGPTIITSVLQVILNVLDHDLPIKDAVDAGRIYSPKHGREPHDVRWDRGLPADVRQGLRARGHSPYPEELGHISQLQAARLTDGTWVGAADSRSAAGGVVMFPARA